MYKYAPKKINFKLIPQYNLKFDYPIMFNEAKRNKFNFKELTNYI